MSSDKHILIVAGEESGDQHGAAFVSKLKTKHPNWHFSGIGGQHLEQAGMELLVNLAQYGVTGIMEVLQHYRVIQKAFKAIQAHILETQPDLIVLIDYPGFNLRLARFIKRHTKVPVLYFIGPQIWAWKAGRIRHIKANVDHMAVILPFEKALYQNAGIPVSYVGHPLSEKLPECVDKPAIRHSLHLPVDKKIVALLPGSRQNEIARHMPILVSVMQKLNRMVPDIHFVIPVAKSLSFEHISSYLPKSPLPVQLFDQEAQRLILASDAVVVASGTASLECALLGIPGCIIYKASPLTALLARHFIKIPYLGLANIIQNDIVMPEFLQQDCKSSKVSETVQDLLKTTLARQRMIKKMHALRDNLSLTAADQSVCDLIENMVNPVRTTSV